AGGTTADAGWIYPEERGRTAARARRPGRGARLAVGGEAPGGVRGRRGRLGAAGRGRDRRGHVGRASPCPQPQPLRRPPTGSPAPAGSGALGWLAVELTVSAALLLAPRYPLLAWRLAYLGAVFAPLIPGQNRVDTGYYVLLTITFVVASLRYGLRPSLVMA